MTEDTYRQSLRKAKVDLVRAVKQRDRLNAEIARLNQLVKALSAQLEEPTGFEQLEKSLAAGTGLTDLIQAIVNRSSQAMSPSSVRTALTLQGYDVTRYANPTAMIHQTLKRLAEQGRIRDLPDGTYKRTQLYEALLGLGKGTLKEMA